VAQEGALDRPDVVKGMLRITRHPFLWGVVSPGTISSMAASIATSWIQRVAGVTSQ
jgi:hypothetical protein